MEILNNIWSVLTTESEKMTMIITLPLLFIEVYLGMLLFTNILNLTFTKQKTLIYVVTVSCVFLITNFVITDPFNLIINYAYVFVLLCFGFKLKPIHTILAIIIPFAIFGLVNTLIMNPFLKLFNTTIELTSVIPIYQFVYLCFVYIVIFVIIILIKVTKLNIKLLTDLDKATNCIILGNLSLGIISLCIQAFLTVYYVNKLPIIITLFNFLLLLSYFVISFYSLNKIIKLHIATKNLETAENYNNSLTILYDNVRGFKHDFDNMVNTIGGYIRNNDINGLKKYYDGLEKDCSNIKNIQVLNPQIINNPGIYNLIVSKYQKAINENININFEFFFDFNTLHMPIYEFSKILGILLDNAIEAAKECDIKKVNLIFRESKKNHVQIVTIENTYSNKEIDTKKIFEKGISGKPNHSGIGLWEVNKIINQHNNTVLHTSKNDELFKQQLEIYY